MRKWRVVVGIDLAGTEKRPTGFCVMGMDRKVESSVVYSDEEIFDKVEMVKPGVIAIDSPLGIPFGRRSLEEREGPHLRKCDRALLDLGIRLFPATLGPMRRLTKRGMKLKAVFEEIGFHVIEAYPGGAQDILGLPRKKDGLEKLRDGLKRIGVKGMRKVMTGDELDAVTSALVAAMYVDGKYLALGDEKEGLMIMPEIKA